MASDTAGGIAKANAASSARERIACTTKPHSVAPLSRLRPEALRRRVAPGLPFRDGAFRPASSLIPDDRRGRLRRSEYAINLLELLKIVLLVQGEEAAAEERRRESDVERQKGP